MQQNVGFSLNLFGVGALLLSLVGCSTTAPAPVSARTATKPATPVKAASERSRPATPQITASTTGQHTVQRGETLYAIAFANNLDYRDVARWNRLESADRIRVAQTLRLTPPPDAVEIQPLDDTPPPSAIPLPAQSVLREPQAVLLPYSEAGWARVSGMESARAENPAKPTAAAISLPPKPAATPVSPPVQSTVATTTEGWQWPTVGTLAGRFGAAGGKGIDIVGQRNTPVKAVAAGKVVYSGSGLRGYGRLLIVKHAGEFLSAYAHNENLLVNEGDMVTAGQNIALMGDSDSDRVMLHFEIRRYGKPLDPLDYLPERT